MSMSLVTSVLLCVVAIAGGISLIAYGFRSGNGKGKK
jgi:hypothetical protein